MRAVSDAVGMPGHSREALYGWECAAYKLKGLSDPKGGQPVWPSSLPWGHSTIRGAISPGVLGRALTDHVRSAGLPWSVTGHFSPGGVIARTVQHPTRSRCEKQSSWVAQGPKPLHGRFLEDVESACGVAWTICEHLREVIREEEDDEQAYKPAVKRR